MITILLSSETKYQSLPEITFLFAPQHKRLNYKEFKLFTIFSMNKYQESQKAVKEEKAVPEKKKVSQVNVSQRESLLGINHFESVSNYNC